MMTLFGVMVMKKVLAITQVSVNCSSPNNRLATLQSRSQIDHSCSSVVHCGHWFRITNDGREEEMEENIQVVNTMIG